MQALDLITDALRDIAVIGQTQTPSAEQGQHGVTKLNDVMASMLEDGIDLGYTAVTLPTDTVVFQAGHVSTIKALLSIAMAGSYGAEIPVQLAGKASSGYERLLGQAFSLAIERAQSDTLPCGENQRWGGRILNGDW